MSGERTAIQLRLPAELVEQLDREAEVREVARNVLARRALEDYLEKLPPVDEVT